MTNTPQTTETDELEKIMSEIEDLQNELEETEAPVGASSDAAPDTSDIENAGSEKSSSLEPTRLPFGMARITSGAAATMASSVICL